MDDNKQSNSLDTKPVYQNMGIGLLGDKSAVFVRKFRWTLGSDTLRSDFIKNVKFNFKNKRMKIEVYEILINDEEINIHSWLRKDLSKETLKFSTYDGLGKEIYTYIFSNLKIISDCSSFDYSSSDASTRKIIVEFENLSRSTEPKKQIKKMQKWLFKIQGTPFDPINVKVSSKPKLETEEVKVPHLNSNMWVPGKSTWKEIEIESESTECFNEIVSYFIQKTSCSVNLVLVDETDKTSEEVEIWTLKNAYISKMHNDKWKLKIRLKYNNAELNVKERKNND